MVHDLSTQKGRDNYMKALSKKKIKSSKIEIAFKHIKSIFPTLSLVIFDKEGRWCYMDEDFNAFNFEGKDTDQGILEDAVDSLEVLPFIYQP